MLPAEARRFLDDLISERFSASVRLACEPCTPTALIEIARQARVGNGSIVGPCFKDADEMEEFVTDIMEERLAVVRAMHIASGCKDCSQRYVDFSHNVQPYIAAHRDAVMKVGTGLMDDSNREEMEALHARATQARTAFIHSLQQARSHFEKYSTEKDTGRNAGDSEKDNLN